MRSHSKALFAVAALSAFLLLAPLAQAAPKGVSAFFGATGTLGGQFGSSAPFGIAVNTTGAGPADPGDIYVVDSNNQRIQRFDALGQFVSLWGKDVIAPGKPGNIAVDEQQTVTIGGGPTGGSFTLSWEATPPTNQTTGPIAWDASPAAVQAALEGLASLEPGDVSVTSPNPGGGVPGGPYTVTFQGVRADTDVTQMTANPAALTPAGGKTVTVATAVPGASFEICSVALNCKAGAASGAISSEGGVLLGPVGIAVDQASGNVYVVDRHNVAAPGGAPRVQAFDGEGNFLWALGKDAIKENPAVNTDLGNVFEACTHALDCKAPAIGAKGGEFGAGGTTLNTGGGNGVAVVPPGLPNAGNLLVTDRANARVQEFTPSGSFVRAFGWDVVDGVANPGAPGDDTAAPVNELEVCTSASTCKAGSTGTNTGQFASNTPNRVAVDSSGDVYTVENSANRRLQRFDAASLTPSVVNPTVDGGLQLSGTGSSDTPMDVAVGPADHLFVVKAYPLGAGNPTTTALNGERRAVELDSSGAYVETHAARAGLPGVLYTAVNPTSEDVYMPASVAPVGGSIGVYILGDSAPPTMTMGVGSIATHTAQLNGLVNPGGPDTSIGIRAKYHFEFRKVGAPTWTALSADKDAGNGFATVPVTETLAGLEADTAYEAKLIALKPFSGVASIETTPEVFATQASQPEIEAAYATDRGSATTTLNARINPNGEVTTYRFEYGPTAAYGTSVPVPDGSAGSSTSSSVFSEALSGLAPETTYHFRVVATNANGTAKSLDQTFTTRGSVNPPEGRAYELVSPPDKVGGSGLSTWYAGVGTHGNVGAPAYEGDRFASTSYYGASIADGGFSYGTDWALAERTEDGWVNQPAFNRPGGVGAIQFALLPNLTSFSDDLSLTSWSAQGQIALFPEQAQAWSVGGEPRGGDVPSPAMRDWTGRWEIVAPLELSQDLPIEENASVRVAPDGGYALMGGGIRGVAGPGDPTSAAFSGDPADFVCPPTACNRNVYLDDVSAGLSDSFPGAGVRSLVNACTGDGSDRTEIPSVDGSGKLAGAICPAALPGRDSRLISPRGGSLVRNGNIAGHISDDGSRVFFMAPDHLNNANLAPCVGTGAEGTQCPPQLYVYQRNEDGSATVRWISRSAVSGQDASLMSAAVFEGATPDGDKVFFRSASPLTADDPNGGAQQPGGVKSGVASFNSFDSNGRPIYNSVDLYMYDFPDAPGADPGEGTLTRISAGPSGAGDANVFTEGITRANFSALRAFGDDGSRAYFTTAAPLPGVPAPSSGTITTPGGTPTQGATRNLYLYDAGLPQAERWRFIAQLPVSSPLGSCAAKGSNRESDGLEATTGGQSGLIAASDSTNCVRPSADGSLITLFTDGRLTADDPDSVTGDVYAYDAVSDELVRISVAQGGSGDSYVCVTDNGSGGTITGSRCHGDPFVSSLATQAPLNMPTGSTSASDRTVFFESMSPLIPEDQNDVYDVYQWQSGELSLLSTGAAGAEPALYRGNDRSGKNVYISTRDRLTWEDSDAVLDVYVARAGGGFDQPVAPPACDVLAGGCKDAPAAPPAPNGASSTAISGQGNVAAKPKPRRCRKGQVRRRGKCVAKKAKKAKRAVKNERRAGR